MQVQVDLLSFTILNETLLIASNVPSLSQQDNPEMVNPMENIFTLLMKIGSKRTKQIVQLWHIPKITIIMVLLKNKLIELSG